MTNAQTALIESIKYAKENWKKYAEEYLEWLNKQDEVRIEKDLDKLKKHTRNHDTPKVYEIT